MSVNKHVTGQLLCTLEEKSYKVTVTCSRSLHHG